MRRTTLAVCLLLVLGTIPATAARGGNVPPEAEAGLDQHVARGATVLLDGGASWDPDGEIASYEWAIRAPNGSLVDPNCGTCVQSRFVPRRVGTYNVTLAVTDDAGVTRTDTLFVVVEPTNGPRVDLTVLSADGRTGDVRANATAGAHELRRLVWRVDGTRVGTDTIGGQEATVDRHLEFATNGTHDVSVTVTDWLGNRGSDTESLGGGNTTTEPPSITIARAPETLERNESGRFVATATDPDGGPVTVRWPASDDSGRSTRLAFDETGQTTVRAIATDDEEQRATTTVNVTVTAAAGGNNPPKVSIVQFPTRRLEQGESGHFVAAATDPDGDPVTLSWNSGASGEETDIAWNSGGTKTVTVTATDGNGGTASDTVTVQVEGGDGGDPTVHIDDVHAPDSLEVGENGTFKVDAWADGASNESVIVDWSRRSKAGETATFSWSSPGTKTVTATAILDQEHERSIAIEVDVVPRSGAVADVNINPKCEKNRSQECGPVTGNTRDPIELSAEPSKASGGTIVTYTWTINGTLVSNQKVFEKVYARGEKHVTLTVEDEHGNTDTTNRTFYVEPSTDTDVDIELVDSISEICPNFTSQCSWQPDTKKLTVVKGATSTFRGDVLGAPDSTLSLEWITPSMTESDTHRLDGETQTVTWAATGSGTLKLRGYQNGKVIASQAATVKVVPTDNKKPRAEITDIEEICHKDSRRTPAGCSRTDAVRISYQVWDPNENDTLTLNGYLSPEDTQPIANEKMSPTKTLQTTQEIPLTEDGEHNFRIKVDDGQAVTEVERSFGITDATGGGNDGGGGIVVDGSWSMGIEVRGGGGTTKAQVEVKCKTDNQSTKCPGKKVKVNWGDGEHTLLESNYESGNGSWKTQPHAYKGTGYPTVSAVVLDDQGQSVTTMQRYLDLEDADYKTNYKFDQFTKTYGGYPDDAEEVGVWYLDKEKIKDPVGPTAWVDTRNVSMVNHHDRDWITVLDSKNTGWTRTSQTTQASYAPYCGHECEWRLEYSNIAKKRGRLLSTKWYDNKKSGFRWELVKTENNHIGSPTYKVVFKLTGDVKYMDHCPTGPVECTLTQSGTGTDYYYEKYAVKTINQYRKYVANKSWKVQTYYIAQFERWVSVD